MLISRCFRSAVKLINYLKPRNPTVSFIFSSVFQQFRGFAKVKDDAD